ncbi:MAG: hypothetical protein DRJ97_00885 [Thermoprotei archaeon]|nr:MAG: hypothetical protein DRJ97_00885 [Thermoprotei archaeon]
MPPRIRHREGLALPPKEKVLVDGMCGRLARWLRMLGFDASYDKELSDEGLMLKAVEEGRVLVTRDVELHERAVKAGVRSILVKSPDYTVQLALVATALGGELEVNPDRSRCPVCNSPLRKVGKEEVKGLVPEKSFNLHDEYWMCTGCSKVYWRGAHWRGISKVLEKAREIAYRGLSTEACS